MKPFIQIAGIKNIEEARIVIACGVDYLGFPLRLNVHTADLPEAEAARIMQELKNTCHCVLITYLNNANEILNFMNYLHTHYVQLHGDIEVEELKKIKSLNKNIFIIKSLVVRENNEEQLHSDVKKFESLVNVFITDTFDSHTGASGATGKVHDWSVSQKLVKATSLPVILAGGLTSDNVGKTIKTVKPAGVDSHTGVEDEFGNKNAVLIKKFIQEINAAYDLNDSV
jgi:phosphoribosylanthranilate isomerase